MRKLIKNTLVCLLIISMLATTIPLLIPSVSASDNWTLTIDARGLKGYPNLQESVWQKNANMAPNGPYDKIGLHRLVQTGITPKDVVFINPGTYGYGEALTSNPATDSFTKTENDSQAIYWANRGFDVYAIDYRTHFVPASLNTSQLGFMANWGWDQWISDIKEAVDKAKDTSGVNSVFMAGQSFGGRATTNYATVYSQDVKGIIMLDGGNASTNPTPYKFIQLNSRVSPRKCYFELGTNSSKSAGKNSCCTDISKFNAICTCKSVSSSRSSTWNSIATCVKSID